MKPVAFEYERPATVAEACALLAKDGNARVIAGGQTLIPMLAMRLARPILPSRHRAHPGAFRHP